jgi:hypothetical protein
MRDIPSVTCVQIGRITRLEKVRSLVPVSISHGIHVIATTVHHMALQGINCDTVWCTRTCGGTPMTHDGGRTHKTLKRICPRQVSGLSG